LFKNRQKEDKSFSKTFVSKEKKLEWVLHNKDLNKKKATPLSFCLGVINPYS